MLDLTTTLKKSMRTNAFILLILGISLFTGCRTSTKTLGELKSGYTYIPIDPFAVQIVPCNAATAKSTTNAPSDSAVTNAPATAASAPATASAKPTAVGSTSTNSYLQFLPDNTVRMAVESIDVTGTVSYGPAAVSVKGSNYKVTIDYVNSDTSHIRLFMCKSVEIKENKSFFQKLTYFLFGKSTATQTEKWVTMTAPREPGEVSGSEHYIVRRVEDDKEVDLSKVESVSETNEPVIMKKGDYYNIPIYIGIGLRVTANIASAQPNVNISGIGSIGASEMSGSLVVQTLGVNGEVISPALPIQTELNPSTVQNAIVSIASIKTHLYDTKTVILPRVVGLYLPFSGGKPLVSAIISELSKNPVKWTPGEEPLQFVSPTPAMTLRESDEGKRRQVAWSDTRVPSAHSSSR